VFIGCLIRFVCRLKRSDSGVCHDCWLIDGLEWAGLKRVQNWILTSLDVRLNNDTKCLPLTGGERVTEYVYLRRIFERKRQGVKWDWRKLHNEELHNLHSSALALVQMIDFLPDYGVWIIIYWSVHSTFVNNTRVFCKNWCHARAFEYYQNDEIKVVDVGGACDIPTSRRRVEKPIQNVSGETWRK
jgi:hypothetical protein